MIISRNQFFGLLFIVIIGPFFIAKAIWLATSERKGGELYFIGHDGLGDALGISTYPVILFKVGRDSVLFRGNVNLPLHVGQYVPVRYHKDNPSDARIDVAASIWGNTLANALGPFLVLLVLFLTPDFLHPLIPWKSKIELGKRPFIRIIKPDKPIDLP
jgi:hypothetical protein